MYLFVCVWKESTGVPENLKAFSKLVKPDMVGNELDLKKKSYF